MVEADLARDRVERVREIRDDVRARVLAFVAERGWSRPA
jgi:hypothetical protein